ncbi:MAG TPA: hypothetical protein DCE77_11530 [Methylophaga sp.]|jgi:hypothetical protein|uniref:hypothetical protein n=1 Tax=unclassified Methylophaga TaxID=2629249 RepID=UPI000C8D913C|nr:MULTISPECIES: hypothetical protein [unclassified Methylophaga]MAP27751.1 hypothetical protein [Methylophaga sp.]HAD32197.1 hypothetical protein [Methylophaga sp.]HBX59856.1 hypothetical protein [Methylophaga sp.]|tara:strand:+ start:85 stop:354 length:270 start_codon:yes stop_codon:yes gene_type:complete
MTLKTYLFPEVAGHGEITEWVPADVARELFEALEKVVVLQKSHYGYAMQLHLAMIDAVKPAEKAIKKACGEQSGSMFSSGDYFIVNRDE